MVVSLSVKGSSHSLWLNPLTGHAEAVSRHTEIPNKLGQKICKKLLIPELG